MPELIRVDLERLIEDLRADFTHRINMKNSWGKNELLGEFNLSISAALQKELIRKG